MARASPIAGRSVGRLPRSSKVTVRNDPRVAFREVWPDDVVRDRDGFPGVDRVGVQVRHPDAVVRQVGCNVQSRGCFFRRRGPVFQEIPVLFLEHKADPFQFLGHHAAEGFGCLEAVLIGVCVELVREVHDAWYLDDRWQEQVLWYPTQLQGCVSEDRRSDVGDVSV